MTRCLTLLLLLNIYIIKASEYDSYRFIGNAPNCILQGCHQKSAGYYSPYLFCNDNVKCDNISVYTNYTYPDTTSVIKACPLLSYLPTQYRSSGLVLNKDCSCPRWQCHHNIDQEPIYNEFRYLQFDWFPIERICTNCTCELWADSYEHVYAWNCIKYSSSGEGTQPSDIYTNITFQCDHQNDVTNTPSSLPTDNPLTGRRLLNQSPTSQPTLDIECRVGDSSDYIMTKKCKNYYNPMCTFSKLSITNTAKDICMIENAIGREINGLYGCYDPFIDDYFYQCPGCFKSSFSFPIYKYDCINDIWVEETYTAQYMFFCCNDEWNCNNKTIEQLQDNCKVMSEPPEYIKYKTECDYSLKTIENLYNITSDRNFIRAAFCGTSLQYDKYKNDTQSLCDLMKVYEKYHTFCGCNLYRIQAANYRKNIDADHSWLIYDDVDYYSEQMIQTHINAQSTLLTNLWKEKFQNGNYWKLFAPYWGCDVADDYFVCNVTKKYEKLHSMETTPVPTKGDVDYHAMNKLFINVIYVGILTILCPS